MNFYTNVKETFINKQNNLVCKQLKDKKKNTYTKKYKLFQMLDDDVS